jgi:uncharacterized protein (UPF0262 family)
MADHRRIIRVTLDEHSFVRRNPDVDHERRVAIFDLLEENHFAPCDDLLGPFALHIGVADNRLSIDVRDADDRDLTRIVLPLTPFRRIIREYFVICESYFNAIKTASPSRIEAIDMGRRGLHNEGADLLRRQLADRVSVDEDTARRLFTLVCVLHFRG